MFVKNYFLVKKIIVDQSMPIIGLQDLYKKNLIILNEKVYEENLLKKNPQLKSVKIKKKLPQTLILDVQKDKVIAKIKLDKGFFYLSNEGKIINKLKEDINSYPLIIFYKKIYFDNYQSGDKIDFIDLKKTLILVDKVNELSLFPYNIDINQNNMIVFNIKDKKIFFSFQKEIDLQIYQLKEIIKNLKIKGEDFKELDLRFNKPILRYWVSLYYFYKIKYGR